MSDKIENQISERSEVIKWCENKSKKLESNLLLFFEEYKNKIKEMNVYPILSDMLSVDNELSKMKERNFDESSDVEYCFSNFKNIISTINLHVVYVPSQQTFCTFMGWTDRVYKKMLNNSTEDIQDMMQLVNEYIIECQFGAGQQGFTKQNLTKFKLQMSGEHGHGLVTQKEQHEIEKDVKRIKTKEQLEEDLKRMGSKGVTVENADKLIK